jgi:hypothetical protein
MIYITLRFKPYSFLKHFSRAFAFVFTCSLFIGTPFSDRFQLGLDSIMPYKRSLLAADIDTASCQENPARAKRE